MGGRLRVHDTPIDEFERQKRRVLGGTVDVVSSVATQFEIRGGLTGNDHLELLEDFSCSVGGSALGQRPPSFAEQCLVHPLLEVLGYDYVVKSRVRFERFAEPDSATFASFRLTNTSYARSDRLVGTPWVDEASAGAHQPEAVGETAGLDNYAEAKEAIRETYVHPFTHVDVGIVTDGLDWGVYVGVPGAETSKELSLRPFGLKIANHVLDVSVRGTRTPTGTTGSSRSSSASTSRTSSGSSSSGTPAWCGANCRTGPGPDCRVSPNTRTAGFHGRLSTGSGSTAGGFAELVSGTMDCVGLSRG